MFSCLKPPPSPFEPPSVLYSVLTSPLDLLTRLLYHLILLLRGPAVPTPPLSSRIRLVCISDTHTHKPNFLPLGDVFIHAGDLTNAGSVKEIQDQVDWIDSLPYAHKIVIAGNHDSYFDPRSRRTEDAQKEICWGSIHYLQHSSIKLSFPCQENRELKFYGAPQIPACGGDDFAFQYPRGRDAWSGIVPLDTDVLITHTPPKYHLDLQAGMGCEFLLKEVWRVSPKLHVFGHVHAGYGREHLFWDEGQRVFESLCGRGQKGLLRDVFNVWAWADVVRLAVHGFLGILWSRVWGGDGDPGTVLLNSALMYRSTGKLDNPPQMIDI
ncbi:hypothetical protein MMC21_005774 [Puttea exsequens]|nr:hypothetical protein [Puttea exsequens]